MVSKEEVLKIYKNVLYYTLKENESFTDRFGMKTENPMNRDLLECIGLLIGLKETNDNGEYTKEYLEVLKEVEQVD